MPHLHGRKAVLLRHLIHLMDRVHVEGKRIDRPDLEDVRGFRVLALSEGIQDPDVHAPLRKPGGEMVITFRVLRHTGLDAEIGFRVFSRPVESVQNTSCRNGYFKNLRHFLSFPRSSRNSFFYDSAGQR